MSQEVIQLNDPDAGFTCFFSQLVQLFSNFSQLHLVVFVHNLSRLRNISANQELGLNRDLGFFGMTDSTFVNVEVDIRARNGQQLLHFIPVTLAIVVQVDQPDEGNFLDESGAPQRGIEHIINQHRTEKIVVGDPGFCHVRSQNPGDFNLSFDVFRPTSNSLMVFAVDAEGHSRFQEISFTQVDPHSL